MRRLFLRALRPCRKHASIARSSLKPRVARSAQPGVHFGTPSNKSVAFFRAPPPVNSLLAERRLTPARRRRGKFSVPVKIADFTRQSWPARVQPHLPWHSNTSSVCSSSSVWPVERHPHRLACCTDLPEAHGVGKTLARGCTEAFSGRTTHIDMLPPRDEIPSRSSPTRWAQA